MGLTAFVVVGPFALSASADQIQEWPGSDGYVAYCYVAPGHSTFLSANSPDTYFASCTYGPKGAVVGTDVGKVRLNLTLTNSTIITPSWPDDTGGAYWKITSSGRGWFKATAKSVTTYTGGSPPSQGLGYSSACASASNITIKGTSYAVSGSAANGRLWCQTSGTYGDYPSFHANYWGADPPGTPYTEPDTSGADSTDCPSGWSLLNPANFGSILRCLFEPQHFAEDIATLSSTAEDNYPVGPIVWGGGLLSDGMTAFNAGLAEGDTGDCGIVVSWAIPGGGPGASADVPIVPCADDGGALASVAAVGRPVLGVVFIVGCALAVFRIGSWALGSSGGSPMEGGSGDS